MLITLPLAFGNITLAAITLAIAFLVLTLVVEGVLKLIYFTAAFDSKDAPEFTLKNPLNRLLRPLYHPLDNIKRYGGVFFIMKGTKARFRNSDNCWGICYDGLAVRDCGFVTKEEAMQHKDYCSNTGVSGFDYILFNTIMGGLLLVDTLILLLQISFIPTLCITLTLLTMFCIRTLAKKFYTGMKKHSDHLEQHDKELSACKLGINNLKGGM